MGRLVSNKDGLRCGSYVVSLLTAYPSLLSEMHSIGERTTCDVRQELENFNVILVKKCPGKYWPDR